MPTANSTKVSKSTRLLNTLLDGRNHTTTVLAKRLNTSERGVRARISDLRGDGWSISHRDGRVRLNY
jgi:biotin operon repressor